jgi:hypothetical protein
MKKDNIKALASYTEIDVVFLHDCLEHGALGPDPLPEDPHALSPAQLARLRRLQRLCASLQIDAYAGAIIVDLLEELDRVRADIAGRP